MTDLPSKLSSREKLVGLLPLGFFLAHGYYYWSHGGLPNMLWMCTVANLLLATGLLLGLSELIRIALFWLVPGLPLWIWFAVIVEKGWLPTSTLSHVGGLAVGLWAFKRVRSAKLTWLYATLWYLIVQQVSRMFTPPEWNINVAHSIYAGYESMFDSYWMYWAATTAMVAVGMAVLSFIAGRVFPQEDGAKNLRFA